VRIISVSASAFHEDQQRAIAAGADDYVSKPFREEVLFGKIQEALKVDWILESGGAAPPKAALSLPAEALRAAVSALPLEITAKLRRAIRSADLDDIGELANQAEAYCPGLALEIRRLVAGYAYESLLLLLDGKAAQ